MSHKGSEYVVAKDLFDKLKDDQGVVADDALKRYLEQQKMSADQIAKILKIIDTNDDGEISWAEFATKGIRVVKSIQAHQASSANLSSSLSVSLSSSSSSAPSPSPSPSSASAPAQPAKEKGKAKEKQENPEKKKVEVKFELVVLAELPLLPSKMKNTKHKRKLHQKAAIQALIEQERQLRNKAK